MPIAVVSSAYVAALPCHVNFANSGSSTWKLKDSVPITAIIARGPKSAGRDATSRSASRTWPRLRSARGDGSSSARPASPSPPG